MLCILFVCVCPYRSVVKNVFVLPKVRWAPLLLHLLFSILPHTFESLCGIVPWSWLGSLLPRPLLASWPAGSRPPPPDRMLPAGGHGSEARSPESAEARGA